MRIFITITTCLLILSSFSNNTSFAETSAIDSVKKGESIRDLIVQLNNDYIALDEALQNLEDGITNFSKTTLNLSVIRRNLDNGTKLISIEVADGARLLKNHIYTLIENEALATGGRHQLYNGELKQGSYTLHITYYWRKENSPPQKGEVSVPISVETGRESFVELSFEKENSGNFVMHYYKFEFSNK